MSKYAAAMDSARGAVSLDETVAALQQELGQTLERAIYLQMSLMEAISRRMTQYELELARHERQDGH